MKKILIFVSLLLVLPFVSASVVGDALNVFSSLDFSSIYIEYQDFIDFFIYLLIFVGLARVVFEQKFQGSGGKAIIIGVGVALSFAMGEGI